MKSMVQAYSIRKLFWKDLRGAAKQLDLTVALEPVNLAIQMFPLDHRTAMLVATNADRAMDGVIAFDYLGIDGTLNRIEYTVLGTPDGERVGIVHFHHDFKSKVRVHGVRHSRAFGIIQAGRNDSLFIPYTMDVILDANEFGKVQGIQFIA